MTTEIFLGYRSGEEAYAAVLLDSSLSKHFGSNKVFRASRSIPPGNNFEETIVEAIKNAKLMLLVIGSTWVSKFEDSDSDDDWVYREIKEAQTSDTLIIPVLLAGVERLTGAQFRADLNFLAKLQYLRLGYHNADQDLATITSKVDSLIKIEAMDR